LQIPSANRIAADVFRLPLRPFIGIVSKTIAITCQLAPRGARVRLMAAGVLTHLLRLQRRRRRRRTDLYRRQGEQGLHQSDDRLEAEAKSASILVAFLLDPNAPIAREWTVGDHRKIPAAIVIRALLKWRRFRQIWPRSS
jgi:hypothetical protein